MLRAYGIDSGRLKPLPASESDSSVPAGVLWIDLNNPSRDEEKAVEARLGLQVPTRQEMAEIEDSARLYDEGGAMVMTAVILLGATEGRPSRTQVTFVLTRSHLVSVRYADPLAFRAVEAKCQRSAENFTASDRVLVSLLESIVERAADVLEGVAAELNEVSTRLFIESPDSAASRGRKAEDQLQGVIRRLGRKNMTVSILRESLLSLMRLVPYLRRGAREWLAPSSTARLKQVERDLASLSAYEGQLSSEIGYLHDATLGLINLEQNRIIKVFSIAAVLFLPPTLVGTIYGMNFDRMPELDWAWGYPFALVLMVISAVLPYHFFKWRGWF